MFINIAILLPFFLLLTIEIKISNAQAGVSGLTFTYNNLNSNGPNNWGNSWTTCSTLSGVQSPIHISMATLDDTLAIPLFNVENDGCFKWVQGANEKYFYLDFTQPGYTCTNLNMQYEGMTWVLQTAVFHSPSEHTLGGGYFDAEVQFRHVSTTNQHVSVVSIFLQADPGKLQSTNNTFLNRLWRGRGMTALMKTTGINITSSAQDLDPYMDFFPASQSHYQYVGSSTEPPCTTDWDWFVFEKPVSISMSDLQLIRALPRAFKGNYLSPGGDNNRPEQHNTMPFTVKKCDGTTIYGASSSTGGSSGASNSVTAVAALAFILAVLALALVVFTHIKLKLFKDETRRGLTDRGTYVDYTAHNPINTAA